MDCYVYGLCDETRVIRYVGQTVCVPQKRLNHHRHSARNGSDYPVHRWIRKHGPLNITVVILAVVPESRLDEEEKKWITLLKENGNLLNCNDGGAGVRAETRVRMSKAQKGIPKSEETKQRMRKPHTPEHRAAIGNAQRGKPKLNLRGRKRSPETIAKMKETWARKKAEGFTRTLTPEGRANIIAANKRRHIS